MAQFDYCTADNAVRPFVEVFSLEPETMERHVLAVFYIEPRVGLTVDECEQRALSLVADLEQSR